MSSVGFGRTRWKCDPWGGRVGQASSGVPLGSGRAPGRPRDLGGSHGRCGRAGGRGQRGDRGQAGPGRAEPSGRGLCDAVRLTVIAVAVFASSAMTRARLEALVAARPGWRLAAPPSPRADQVGDPVGGTLPADVLLVDPGPRPVEAYLRALSGAARLPPIMLLGGGVNPAAFARLLRAGVRAILPRDSSSHENASGIDALAAEIYGQPHSATPDVPYHTGRRTP